MATTEPKFALKRRICTIRDFCKDNPMFSANAVRWWIHRKNLNGLKESGAIVRIGRRLYIDVDKLGAWIDSRN